MFDISNMFTSWILKGVNFWALYSLHM